MVRIDEEVSQILEFGLELLRCNREDAHKLQEVEEQGLADLQQIVGMVERPSWSRGRRVTGFGWRR